MKAIIFYIKTKSGRESRRILRFNPRYFDDSDPDTFKIAIPNEESGKAVLHVIPRKDVSEIVNEKELKEIIRLRTLNSLTSY